MRTIQNVASAAVLLALLGVSSANYAVLRVKDGMDLCLNYNPNWAQLPVEPSDATYNPLIQSQTTLGCEEPAAGAYQDSAVLVSRGNCTFADKILHAQAAGSVGVIVAQNAADEETFAPTGSPEEYTAATIPAGMISQADAMLLNDNITAAGDAGVQVSMFMGLSGTNQIFRFSNTMLLLLAVTVVTCGSLLAHPKPKSNGPQRLPEHSTTTPANQEDDDIQIKHVFMAFVFISLFLVGMYFLFDYLVYLFIAFFTIGATASMSQIFDMITPCIPRKSGFLIPRSTVWLAYKDVVLLCGNAVFCIVWAVFRNEEWAWVMQDIMGACLCMALLCNVQLPSLKIGLLIMGLFWIYDVFMTFITPLFTPHGDSVMVAVATGSGGEQIPLVFKIVEPKHSLVELACGLGRAYGMLGFGDICIPGTFICYLLSVDRSLHPTRQPTYWLAALLAYIIGLILCYIALFYMKMGQPALLYINPCLVLATVAQAFIREDLHTMWNGDKVARKNSGEPLAGLESRMEFGSTENVHQEIC